MRPADVGDYLKLTKLAANPWEIVRFRKAGRPGALIEVRLREGGPVFLRSGFQDYHLFQRIFLQDEYRLSRLGEGKAECIVDLGANIGLFAARASSRARRVIAFEPVGANFDCLQRNIAGRPNVAAFREAVAGAGGTVKIFHPEAESRSGTYSSFFETDDHAPERFDEVPAVTLDEIFDLHEIARCDLLKLDVEGQEYEILHAASDATLARIERIHGEYHDVDRSDPRTRIDNFTAFLSGKGFEVEVLPHRTRANHGKIFATRR